ncbi:MAG: hypothetical protein CME64_11070 [Halobacteriovoraceae bacterium]|nr:hypothetical protein [Halobacteriovoraceae bacterium]
MKKNIVLSAVFFALVGVGWLIEERSLISSEEKSIQERLYNFGREDIQQIKLPKASVVKKESGYFVESLDLPIDPISLEKLLKNLNSLYFVKEIESADTNEYFKHQSMLVEVVTTEKKIKFRIGDVSDLTGTFYIEQLQRNTNKLVVVKNKSVLNDYYKNELDADLKKYLELKDLINSTPIDLVDKRLLNSINASGLKKLKIDNRRNRWFELNFANKQTTPPPPSGISTRINQESVAKRLLGIKFKSFKKVDGGVLDDLLSTVELESEGQSIVMKLYGLFNREKGPFLVRSDRPDTVYTLGEGREIFFENVQSFWSKKLQLPRADILKMKRLKFKLGKKSGKMRDFFADDIQKTFKISSANDEVHVKDSNYFYLLFNAVFANGAFSHADIVQKLGPKELRSIVKELKDGIQLEFLDKTLLFSIKDDTLIMLDIKDRLQFIYTGKDQLRPLKEDLFFAFK